MGEPFALLFFLFSLLALPTHASTEEGQKKKKNACNLVVMLLQRSTQTSTSPFTRENQQINQRHAACLVLKGTGRHLSRSTAKGRSRSRSRSNIEVSVSSILLPSRKEPNDKLPGIITWLPSARWGGHSSHARYRSTRSRALSISSPAPIMYEY